MDDKGLSWHTPQDKGADNPPMSDKNPIGQAKDKARTSSGTRGLSRSVTPRVCDRDKGIVPGDDDYERIEREAIQNEEVA
jgi:hypothetical protein